MAKMKICVIGAGSPYTPELIDRLAMMQEQLPVEEIALMDVDEKRLDIMYGFCQRYRKHLQFDVKITKTRNRKKAIEGCTFVNSQFRVGLNEARVRDEKIPLSMNLVGQETTGAGGFMKAMRTIPAILEIAGDVEQLAPDAWIINYTNPTGLVAQAVTSYTKAKIAGLCAGGMFAQNWAAEALGVAPESVRYDFIGLNHMNFSYNLSVDGKRISAEEFARVAEQVGSVSKELILQLGALPSPYLQYYYHTGKKVWEMNSASLTRGEEVIELEKELFAEFADESNCLKPQSLKKRGGGGYSEIATKVMHALYNNQDTWAVVNVPNRGAVKFLPDDAVIETPCMVNAAGITPCVIDSPPKGVWGLISAVKNYEQLAVEAAVKGDFELAYLALTAHPLVRDYDVVCQLLPKLFEANKQLLPQFYPGK